MNNEFPINVFPPLFKDLVMGYNKSLNFPIDYTGTAILSAVSTAVGNSAKLKVCEGWLEPAMIYAILVGQAGANKTHPLSKVFEVIHKIDRAVLKEFTQEFEKYQSSLKVIKPTDGEVNITEPVLSSTMLINYTPEALFKQLSNNYRGCIVKSDEVATFLENMNSYSKGNEESRYLSIWNGEPIIIHRKSTPIPIAIDEPFLNIIGGIQPRMIPKLLPMTKTDNGFFQRWLFAYPDISEKKPLPQNEMDLKLLNAYEQFILNYIGENPINFNNEGQIASKVYTWSAEAREYFFNWQESNTASVNSNPSVIGEVINKFDNYFVRFALLLQIMENYNTPEIGINAVKGADRLCEYFINCSIKVIDGLKNPPKLSEVLPSNKYTLYQELPIEDFSTGTAVRLGQDQHPAISERTVKDFIGDRRYFDKIGHGVYKKKY